MPQILRDFPLSPFSQCPFRCVENARGSQPLDDVHERGPHSTVASGSTGSKLFPSFQVRKGGPPRLQTRRSAVPVLGPG